MAHYSQDILVAGKILANGGGLFWIAALIANHQFQHPSVDTAGLVYLFDLHQCTVPYSLTVGSSVTGHRSSKSQLDWTKICNFLRFLLTTGGKKSERYHQS